MANAEYEEVLPVNREAFFKTVTAYERYPEFVEGCKKVEVKRDGAKTQVTYHINMMKDISYTLEHTEDLTAGRVTWSLVASDFLKKNIGHWEIDAAAPGTTRVKYVIDIDFNFPIPGMILNRLVKGSLPSMIKSFKNQTLKK
jgi:ribosome-associated toxin RatA of RatAB toxin-antitoxin module